MTSSLIAQLQLPRYDFDVITRGGSVSDIFTKPFIRDFVDFFNPSNPISSLGFLMSRIIPFTIVIAGLIFFFQLISAGFSYMTAAGDSAKIQSATKNLTNALIGLLVVISAFFLAQIIQVVFGITLL